MMRVFVLTLALACGLVLPAAARQEGAPREAAKPQFKAGQVWSYKTRPGEKDSTFVVVKVEELPVLGRVVHVAVLGLKLRKPNNPGDHIPSISHMPFTEEAVARSAVKLLKEKAELPDYEEGYKLWREAFEAERAGAYTITVAEAVQVAEDTLNQ